MFILSLRLFIASCKAAPAHFQCIRQSSNPLELRAERDKGVRRITARSTGETPCHRNVPSAAPQGTEVRVSGITGWQLPDRYYTQAANSDGVYSNAEGRAWRADSAAIRALKWTGGNPAHSLLQTLSVLMSLYNEERSFLK